MMENRNSVRALREKFELQAEEQNRSRSSVSRSKFGSQTTLFSQLGSLHLSDSITSNSITSNEILNKSSISNSRLSIGLPLPSVLPTQVLKPRPFSYSEATGSGSIENGIYSSYIGSPPTPPPEKPPRTFLYDLLSDPPSRDQVQPTNLQSAVHSDTSTSTYISSGVSLRRKMPLTSSVSLPRDVSVDTPEVENGIEVQSVPVHRKAIYISDGPVGVTRRKKKTKTIRSFPFGSDVLSTIDGDMSDMYGSFNGYTHHESPPESLPPSSPSKYLSATKEMNRLLEKQSQAALKISTANIRPIQVSSGTQSQFQGQPPVKSSTTTNVFSSSSGQSPQRLLRAKTESDILSSTTSQRSWRSVQVPVCDSSDYGSLVGESDTGDRVSLDQFKSNCIQIGSNHYGNGLRNYLNPYYYPRGLQVGPDGKLSREPISADHPNHFAVGLLQNYQQFFESEDSNCYSRQNGSCYDKYLEFIRRYHPELEGCEEPALFYRQGTSVTVVPPWQKSSYLSKFCSTSPSSHYSSVTYSSKSSIMSQPELGIWRNPTNAATAPVKSKVTSSVERFGPPTTPRPIRPTELRLARSAKSKSEWNLNDPPVHDHDHPTSTRRHSTQNFSSARAVFLEGSHDGHDIRSGRQQFQNNSRNNNGFHAQSPMHHSIHSLVNQIYPVGIDSVGSAGKDVTSSSTDSGIQIGADSLSSCDTPLTGDSTTDTGDSDCENDSENLEAIRQVVEQRKGYIRRVSSIRTTELLPLQRLLRNRPLPETLPPPSEHGNDRGLKGLFDNLLVIGIRRDEKTGAYHPIIKYKFPHSTVLPDGIERFCFPDSMEWPCHEGTTAQFYTLTVTQSDGSRKYGCCYRILPDGANICIPIAYCIITQTRAIGFYRKVLQVLASRHGYCEAQMNFMINELYEEEVPDPGKNLLLKDPTGMVDTTNCVDYDMAIPLMIRRKADVRLENNDLYLLLTTLDLSIALKLFGSLLLERKIILLSKHLNLVSLCVEALESMLYPFSWQHTFVPILPLNMTELLELPAPFVIGALRSQVLPWDIKLDEGIVVDLDQKKILSCEGDEGNILPKRLYRKLREALQSVLNLVEQTENTRNVLISECFIRMFVETVGHHRTSGTFESCFFQNPDDTIPEIRVFKKEMFLKSVTSKSNRDFLDWFTETSMFQQFIESRKQPDFKPGLFEQRCMEQSEQSKDSGFHQNNNAGTVPWKHPSILSKGTAWIKGAFNKERD